MRCLMAMMAVAVAGCAEPPPSQGPVAVLGTPILWAVKVPFCVATLAVAAPLAAISELAQPSPIDVAAGGDTTYAGLRADLEAGAAANCGPPYQVSP
jgi:hypothetical protein